MFWGGKLRLCQTFCQKRKHFPQNSSPKSFLKCPIGDGISDPASRFEAPGHHYSWHPPQPRSRAEAEQPPRSRTAPLSGAPFRLRRFPPGPSADDGEEAEAAGRRMLWAAELRTRSTDKQTINVLDSTSSKLFKEKTFTNTLNKFQGFLTMFKELITPVRTM